jgi:DNA-binding transcriptional LysR family regulator
MPKVAERTSFTKDIQGRYLCNDIAEVNAWKLTGGRPFDVIVGGGGTFGAAIAEHVWFRQKQTGGGLRTLVIEAGLFTVSEHVPEMIRTFGERHPEVELALHQLTVPEQLVALRDGRIHIGILRPPVSYGDLATERLVSEPLIIIFPRGHRFGRYRRVPWRRLADEPYIALTAQSAPAFQAVVANACRDAGIVLRIRHEVDHPQTLLALVAAGIGISLVPASVQGGKRTGIDYRGLRPIGPALKTRLAWRRDRKSPLVEASLGVVRELRVAPRRRRGRRRRPDSLTAEPVHVEPDVS